MDIAVTSDTDYHAVIGDICGLNWRALDSTDISAVAWAYYYFSIQFRENLAVAHRLYPDDQLLARLLQEECNTDNLSPWPGVAQAGEKLNHDEFMRRVLRLTPIDAATQRRIQAAGLAYLARIRAMADLTRAMSIASYEDGGLEDVFTAFLKSLYWNTPLLEGFRHFLVKHIAFDGDPNEGHGALARHLAPDNRITGLWNEFYILLVTAAPRLAGA
jgi:hypothetical protein